MRQDKKQKKEDRQQGEVVIRERSGVEPGYEDENLRHERTKIKVYELFAQRGYMPGDDMQDWFDAEQLLEEEDRRLGEETENRREKITHS